MPYINTNSGNDTSMILASLSVTFSLPESVKMPYINTNSGNDIFRVNWAVYTELSSFNNIFDELSEILLLSFNKNDSSILASLSFL